MVTENVVREVYNELRQLKAEAETNKENPRLVRLMDLSLRLTRLDAGEPEAEQPEQSKSAEPETVAESPGECEHKHISIFGRCQDCGQCLHTDVRNGTCLTCDAQVTAG